MAFIVPSKAFSSGSPILGALTGLTHGLAQGMRVRHDQDIHAADQALREKAFAHGLQNETDQQAFFGALGQYAAGSQGTPEQPAPGGIGPPTPGAPPDMNARIQQAHSIASQIKSPQALEAFLSEVHKEEAQRAAVGARDRVAADIKNRILQGSYKSLGPGDTEDESATAGAQALLEHLTNADANDPHQLAALVDHAEQQDAQLRVGIAQHNAQMAMRQKTGEKLLGQMEQSWGSGHSIDEATSVYHLWQAGVLDDKGLEKVWPDAIAGTLTLKNNLLAMKAQLDAANMELLRTRAGAVESPDQRLNREKTVAETKGEEQRKTDAAKSSLVLPAPRAATMGERSNAVARAAKVLSGEFPLHGLAGETDEQKAAYAAREKFLRKDVGLDPQDAEKPADAKPIGSTKAHSAAMLLDAYNKGEKDWPSIMELAKKLGFNSTEELMQAAGRK